MSPMQTGILRDKLLELKIFTDQQDRRRLIVGLPFGSSIPQDNVPDHETEAIIEKCSEGDYGFAALLEVLSQMTSEPLDDFIVELDRIQPSPIVTWADLQTLKAELQDKTLPSEEFCKAALRETMNALYPRIYLKPPAKWAQAERFLCHIDYLARLIIVEPLYNYLERCRSKLSSDVADILLEWKRKLDQRLGTRVFAGSAAPVSGGAVATSGPAVLQVKFAPTPTTESITYEIKAWLFRGKNFEEFDSVAKELTDSCACRSFEKANLFEQARFLRETFRNLVLEVLDLLDGAEDLRIEVFLPNCLLNSRIDLWRIPFGKAEMRAIALQYPIVVRSLDRLYSLPYRPTRRGWIEKWRKLPAALQPSQITWALEPAAYEATMFDKLEKSSLTFVGLTLVPKFDLYRGYPRDQGVLEKLISAGIPIAVWTRKLKSGSAEATRKELEERLLKFAPRDWPRCVLECRQNALPPAKESRIPCRGMALLWDNPNHLPPDCWRRPLPTQRKAP